MQGKIIKGIAGFYYVHDGIGKVYECHARGVFRNRNIKPLVGDDVPFWMRRKERGILMSFCHPGAVLSGRPSPMWTRRWWSFP